MAVKRTMLGSPISFHGLTALVGLLLAGGHLFAARLAITWHGQSFFEIVTSSGLRVAIDPHAIENYGRRSVKADLVLLSPVSYTHLTLPTICSV